MSITAVIDVVAHAAHKSNNAAFFTKVTPTKTGTVRNTSINATYQSTTFWAKDVGWRSNILLTCQGLFGLNVLVLVLIAPWRLSLTAVSEFSLWRLSVKEQDDRQPASLHLTSSRYCNQRALFFHARPRSWSGWALLATGWETRERSAWDRRSRLTTVSFIWTSVLTGFPGGGRRLWRTGSERTTPSKTSRWGRVIVMGQ